MFRAGNLVKLKPRKENDRGMLSLFEINTTNNKKFRLGKRYIPGDPPLFLIDIRSGPWVNLNEKIYIIKVLYEEKVWQTTFISTLPITNIFEKVSKTSK